MHQLNCTYYSALGEDDERYLAARAIQLFARGVPQIYYVGLLAGANDHASVERTAEGRADEPPRLHRRTRSQVALDRSVVRRVIDLVRLRNTHPAFEGDLLVEAIDGHAVRLRWQHANAALTLDVDFGDGRAFVTDGGRVESLSRWATSLGTSAV